MRKLRGSLPPPNLLVAFEAAGRLLSFTMAARELNVTRVAVSQQMKALESYLGIPLFLRQHRSLSLTQAGDRYHRSISIALDQAVHATAEICKRVESNIVNVTATAGFTTYWLMPQIGEFRARHPEIDLRFVISDKHLNLLEENIDVGIRYGTAPFGNVDSTFLVGEQISPTCASSFSGADRIREPLDLLQFPLIHLDGPYDTQTRWSFWFHSQGLQVDVPRGDITVNTYTNLVQATLDGQGFALIGPPLAARYLASGTLLQPLTNRSILRNAFHLVTPRNTRPSAAAALFCAWVREFFTAETDIS